MGVSALVKFCSRSVFRDVASDLEEVDAVPDLEDVVADLEEEGAAPVFEEVEAVPGLEPGLRGVFGIGERGLEFKRSGKKSRKKPPPSLGELDAKPTCYGYT